MTNQILTALKIKFDDISANGEMDAETKRNVLKEELQFYALNFIYHHPEHSKWIMYGGSSLRIIHGLDRMSVDLDFEVAHPVTEEFLEELKREVGEYFTNNYGIDSDFLAIKITTGRGLLLKFNVGDSLNIGHSSKQVHVKIDLNHFVAPKTVIERRPINRDQFSFVIVAYNMSALMASKIAAIFSRGPRGIGKEIYEEKGRDIYDLLWYMNKKISPDLDYLSAKVAGIKDFRTLFDKLTLQMNKVSDDNLKQDLSPLFLDQSYIKNWLQNWRESYFHLVSEYKINTVTILDNIEIFQDFNTDNFYFTYRYNTEEGGLVRIIYTISDYWIDFSEGDLSVEVDKKIGNMIKLGGNGTTSKLASQDKLKQYATLFYQKTENYFKKINRVMLGDNITTKLIRMIADNLNQKEQIVLNKSALLSCELDDLLK